MNASEQPARAYYSYGEQQINVEFLHVYTAREKVRAR